jgi:hypothetical protein
MNKMRILQVNDILEQLFFTAAGYAVEAPVFGDLVGRITLKDYETYVIAPASKYGAHFPRTALALFSPRPVIW